MDHERLDAFIRKWRAAGGAERANAPLLTLDRKLMTSARSLNIEILKV